MKNNTKFVINNIDDVNNADYAHFCNVHSIKWTVDNLEKDKACAFHSKHLLLTGNKCWHYI